jgi:hypothetical protein
MPRFEADPASRFEASLIAQDERIAERRRDGRGVSAAREVL